jgi:hypothetical protein
LIISKDEFLKCSGVELEPFYRRELEALAGLDLIKVHPDRIECTLLGSAFNNDVATYFMTASARQVKHPQATQLIREGI